MANTTKSLDKREFIEFVINDFTPDTLPMARLAEYMAQLATLYGERERVHFVELGEGSAKVVSALDPEATNKVRTRIANVRAGDGPAEGQKAYTNIDEMLRADGTFAHIRRRADAEPTGRLLQFPGASRQLDEEFGPFNEPGQLYGVPINVGGKSTLANVNLEDGRRVHYCEATRDIAVQIAPLIYNHPIRVTGIGKHFRHADGQWEMKNFRILSFEKLEARPLAETVERLRGITRKTKLDENIIAKLAELREG